MQTDGKTIMRKKARYIIPILIFLISLSLSAYKVISYKVGIKSVINTAGENGWPVIAVTKGYDNPSLWLMTLDVKPVSLFTHGCIEDYENIFFNKSGNLCLHNNRNTQYRFFEFPDYNSQSCKPMYPGLSQYSSRDIIYNGMSGGVYVIDPSSLFSREVVLVDITSGVINEFEFTQEPPWEQDAKVSSNPGIMYQVVRDYLFIVENSTNTEVPDPNYPDIRTQSIWRYQISNDSWKHIADCGERARSFSTAPDGSVVGLTSKHGLLYYYTEFFDCETGDLIMSEDNCKEPRIGKRWAACKGNLQNGITYGAILFDMDDNWERYEIDWSTNDNGFLTYSIHAIYEPPPDGLAGMGDE